MMDTSIDLGKLIAPLISTRLAVKIVEEKVLESGCTNIIIDFKNVDFISRSFACAIVKMKKNFEEQKRTVNFLNMNKDVEQMIKIAEEHISNPPKKENLSIIEDDNLLKLAKS
ncbi:MAG: STAS domain-containing protein [Thermoplasmata archaeon]|nr:STAS domain-containing protein [Thermoplasmata archaeon]